MANKIDTVVDAINKKYGAGTIIGFSDGNVKNIDVIPTGSLALDYALGIGGFPRGRITEIIGNPAGGKTTLCLHAIAEAQKQGLNALFIDAEHTLDIFYAAAIGVDIGKLYINQPDSGEQALQIAEDAIKSNEFGLVIVDSVAALVPKRELEGEMGDAVVGLQARLMSQACRKITPPLFKSNTAMIFVNQYRANINSYGGPTKLATGGKALDYYSSVIVDVARKSNIGDKDDPIAARILATIRKNKLAPPFRVAEFDITFGEGISIYGEVIDLAETFGIIKRAGSWYKNGDGESLAQGRQNLIVKLKEDNEFFEQLYTTVRSKLG